MAISAAPNGRLIVLAVCGAGGLLLLAGCAASANSVAGGDNAPGFWLGLWQGFIAPIAFLVSLFNPAVGIYEIHNGGAWYDFGFLVGLSMFFSAPAGARGRPRSAKKHPTRMRRDPS